jgi:hypothetical protein
VWHWDHTEFSSRNPMQVQTMLCPKCGKTMNHHADKLVAPATQDDINAMDETLGGIVQETHACAGCGNVEFRRSIRTAASREL